MTPEKTAAPETTGAKDKVRPFPWTCPRCLQEQVFSTVVPYRAQGRRNGQLVTADIPALKIPKCTNCGELLFTESGDQQIRVALDSNEARWERASANPQAPITG